jgi:hypothetical protein
MNLDFEDSDYRELYQTAKGRLAQRFPPPVIDRFFERMAEIAAAQDQRD